VAAFATWPDGKEPKSAGMRISSGLGRPNTFLSTCTIRALAADATAK
jgi:hypothetical protein